MQRLTAAEFAAAGGVEDWTAADDGATARFRTGDFATGAALFARIADLADAANHHPDVGVRYGSVEVHVATHSAGGLTDKDLALAREISVAARELGIRSAD